MVDESFETSRSQPGIGRTGLWRRDADNGRDARKEIVFTLMTINVIAMPLSSVWWRSGERLFAFFHAERSPSDVHFTVDDAHSLLERSGHLLQVLSFVSLPILEPVRR